MNPVQEVRRDQLLDIQDVASPGAVTSTTYFDMRLYRSGCVNVQALLAESATAVVQLMQATDDTGSDEKVVSGKSVTLTGGSGGSCEYGNVEFRVSDLDTDNDFCFAGVRVTTDTASDDIAATLERHEGRYVESTMPDTID